MGRPASGWKCKQRKEGHSFWVRFTWAGKKYDINTETSDPELAPREAARLYAEVVSRVAKPQPKPTKHVEALEGLIEQWLYFLTATHDFSTIKTWKGYAESHWLNFFKGLHDLNDQTAVEYRNLRLRAVLAVTVRKELSALRSFAAWLYDFGPDGAARPGQGYLPTKMAIEGIPKRVPGTRFEKRRRSAAIEISPDEVRAILAKLPEWSESKKVAPFPVQARFIVAYETSLRPETLDLLSVPEHYGKGRQEIVIEVVIDKSRYQREVPLTGAARAALDSVCPKQGVIFGHHDYRGQLKKAVLDALPKHRADLFAGAHLRSARITHWLENTKNIAGAQHMAGHKLMSTTARYVKPSKRAAVDLLESDRVAKLPPAPGPPQLQGRPADGPTE
jgi:site-specific recombinase XerC